MPFTSCKHQPTTPAKSLKTTKAPKQHQLLRRRRWGTPYHQILLVFERFGCFGCLLWFFCGFGYFW
jgi:hypothetical protein